MAPEPINIFSRKVDPRGVLRILQSLSKNVVVAVDFTPENATDAGPQPRLLPEDHWKQADVILVKKGIFAQRTQIVHWAQHGLL